MHRYVSFIVACCAALLASLPPLAMAEDFGIELRGGLFSHSTDDPKYVMGIFSTERIHDLNVELLFEVPGLTEWVTLGTVRPHVGSTLNTSGLESMVYAGVSWTVPLFDTPVFVEASFGGALHNGSTQGHASQPARDLGCTLLFRESVSLGYALTDKASIMATIEHASNANLCHHNRGLTNIGLRIGYKF